MSRAHIVHVLGTGEQIAKGIALTVLNLADLLDASRYRLSAIFLRDDGPIGRELRSKGMEVQSMDWHGGKADIGGAMRFARALRSLEPDIVHLHAGGMSPRIVSKLAAGAHVVVHYHSLEEESKETGATRRSQLGADLVIANSKATARTVEHMKPIVVYPGVSEPKNLTRTNHDCFTVGVAARLAKVKGIAYLIEAISHLDKVQLEIAGDGPERRQLEAMAIEFGVEKDVSFSGWIDDMSTLMSRWDVYVQPSIAEGFGVAALEAMSYGIPVVATQVGGLPEIVVDSATGFLVPPKSAGRLADRIRDLQQDESLRTRLGEEGRKRALSMFSRERECAAIQSAYEKLIA